MGSHSGNNGQRIVDETHNDIDWSRITVVCKTGSCRVMIEERIWSSWKTRLDDRLNAGDKIDDKKIEVDSSLYDGDHKLIIRAEADGTSVEVDFVSRDD